MEHFDEDEFREMVDEALKRVRTVLDTTKNPQYAADVPHKYDDKFLLAEVLTRTAIASIIQCLELVGVTKERLTEMREWAKTRSVSLRLRAEEKCTFLREETKKVESKDQHVR